MLKLAQVPDEGRHGDAAEVLRAPRPQHLYYAFLSYSHKDQELADWLHRELEQFRVPRSLAGHLTSNGVIPKRLKPVFRDRHELAASDDLGEEIREALASSRFLVVLCSPAAAKSRWTNAEIETFKRNHPDGCVLAAIVSGEPFASDLPGRADEECFPPALTQKYDRRGRPTGKRTEPLAADLRDAGDGRRTGFLKLVAGMLGVGLDDLVQRETTHRHRRLAWITAASIAGMLVASALTVTAFQARDAARDQRREAEGLVAFMVGDLRAKLEPIGRLDALDGVGSRVLDYYKRQDTSELSDAALLQRSRALNLMAEVAYLRGNLEEADGLYRQAMAGTAEAVRRSPEDPKRLFDHAQNVFWLGELARFRGQAGRAVSAYREYKRLADQLVAIEPDNLRWRWEGLFGVENIGIVLYNERHFVEAARQFDSVVGPMQNLSALDPANMTYQKELSTALAWSADAQRAQGRLEPAIVLRERQISLLDRAIANGAADVDFGAQLIPAHRALGILLTSRGQAQRGLDELRAAVDEADRLIPVEPQNAIWKELAAAARLDLARTLLSVGRTDEAAKETNKACAVLARLATRGPATTGQTACLTMRSRLAFQSGATADALALAQRALASARSQRSVDPIKDRYAVASAYRLIGDIRQRSGDSQAAKTVWAAGLNQLPARVTESPWEMNERAELLRRLGRSEDSEPLVARLAAMGYRSVN